MKIVSYGEEARKKIVSGVNKVANAVRVTIGPSGRNVILGSKFDNPVVTNDGFNIVRDIELEDEFENLGAGLIKQASIQSNDDVGDGTTTAVVIAQEIVNRCMKFVSESLGVNLMQLRKELEDSCKEVVEILEGEKIKEYKLFDIAKTSSGDDEIAKMVSGVFDKIGVGGNVILEDSKGSKTEVDISEGMKIESGCVSNYLLVGGRAEMENAHVAIFEGGLQSLEDIRPILERVKSEPIVIIASDFDNIVLSAMVTWRINGALNPILVKSPGYGDQRKELLEDIAAVTGAKVAGKPTFEDLGTIKRVVSDLTKTILIGGESEKRIKDLESREVETEYEKQHLKDRVANISGRVATIYIGGNTEVEQREKKFRIEDAVSACNASGDGVVMGGGLALVQAETKMLKETDGAKILAEAIKVPRQQIIDNGCLEVGKDVIDPFNVTKSALENAVSVSKTIITTEAIITDKNEENKQV
jgi:chaperonin GroEL